MGNGDNQESVVNGNSGVAVAIGVIGISSKFINLPAK